MNIIFIKTRYIFIPKSRDPGFKWVFKKSAAECSVCCVPRIAPPVPHVTAQTGPEPKRRFSAAIVATS